MTDPRILIIGSNGQVGWELRRALAPAAAITAVDYPDIDLTRKESIRETVRRAEPTVIINAAAYTAVDRAETDTATAMQVNAEAPGLLAEEARAAGAWMIHYSTDYVFDGASGKPYVETDAPNPLSAYGRSKLEGDLAVIGAGGLHLIFRLCWVYGRRGANFLLTMQRLAREREQLRVVSDQFGCPTWSRLIAEATGHALRHALASPRPGSLAGVYHLASSTHTSWHGFADAIINRMPADQRRCRVVEPIPSSEYPLPARRPAWSVLDCGKLHRTFGLRLPAWSEGLDLALGD